MFLISDKGESIRDLCRCQGSESESRTTTLQGGDNFGDVISNQTKAAIFGVFFHDATQGELCVARHGVGFVKNNELDARCE